MDATAYRKLKIHRLGGFVLIDLHWSFILKS